MGFPFTFKTFSLDSWRLPANHVHQSLLSNPEAEGKGLASNLFWVLRRILSRNKIDGGSRSEEEERVYAWLYALAKCEKDIVFEYVGSTERGLSFTEAEKRLKENGPNTPLEYTFPSWWNLLWKAFFHPFNIILVVLSALSYLASDSANGCIMMMLVFISVSLRFYQEFTSSKAAMRLSEFVRCPIKVQRCAGRVVQTELFIHVDQRDIVPGDIILFEPGDLFPGDVRLLTSKGLAVSQSSLTGEFGTTDKTADTIEDPSTPLLELKNICFMGTSVISGSGSGLVVSTGTKTYMSTMFSHIGKQKQPDDFDRGIRRISYVLVSVMLVITAMLILVDYFKSRDLSESILFGISVASALTPQMLPLIVNTGLAKGALAMARDRCIVKGVNAIRDMGSMDILCIDKTGTLTMNRAIMVNYFDSWGSPEEKKKDSRRKGYDASVESDMIFLGLVYFFDQPKDTAKQALWHLAEKGVKAKVLTGDSLPLAIRICKEVGILTTHVTTGPALELLSQDSFHETVKRATVLARLTPTLKLRVVQSLQTVGEHIVGFLGDGVNDSLALEAANVGISVDSGASIAKDFADIILLEKDLNVLVAGVERGRITSGNTMKYIKMSVIANIGSIFSLFIATLVVGVEPLSPRQLLIQNFLFNIGQIAIPWDKMEEDYVKTPQRWSLKGLALFILWNGPVCSICDLSTILFISFCYKVYSPLNIVFFRSAWFMEGLLVQTLIIHLIRTEKIPFIQEIASWPVIFSTVLISATGIAIPYSPIGAVMGFEALPLSYLGFLVVVAIGYFVVGQGVKRAYIMVYNTWL